MQRGNRSESIRGPRTDANRSTSDDALPCGPHRTVPHRQDRRTEARVDGASHPRHHARRRAAASSTSPPTRSPRPARRSTPSTSTRCPTATPAPTCSSPSPPPATRCARPVGARPRPDLGDALAALARGALLGARGNSGVILSQMLGAIVAPPRPARGADERNAAVVAEAMQQATDASYAAVGTPVEGTILTVARAASEAALRARRGGRRPGPATCSPPPPPPPARPWPRTPEQLQVLARRRRGRRRRPRPCVVLDAAETVAHRHVARRPYAAPIGTHRDPGRRPRPERRPHRGRPGLRGDVPPRRRRRAPIPAPAQRRSPRSATPWSWSAARACGTSTSTSTTWAPRSRPASRRPAAPGPGHPLRRAGRRAREPPVDPARAPGRRRRRRARPGRALRGGRRGRRRAAAPASARRPGSCSRRSRLRRRGGRRAAQRPRLGAGRRDRGPHRREDETASTSS